MTRLQELIGAIPPGSGRMCNIFDREERLIAIIRAYHEALKDCIQYLPDDKDSYPDSPYVWIIDRFEQEFGK